MSLPHGGREPWPLLGLGAVKMTREVGVLWPLCLGWLLEMPALPLSLQLAISVRGTHLLSKVVEASAARRSFSPHSCGRQVSGGPKARPARCIVTPTDELSLSLKVCLASVCSGK